MAAVAYIHIYIHAVAASERLYNIVYTSYFPIAHRGKPCLRAWIPVDMNWWFGPFINYLTYHRRRRRVCEYIMYIDSSSSSRRRGRRRVWRAPRVREKRVGGELKKMPHRFTIELPPVPVYLLVHIQFFFYRQHPLLQILFLSLSLSLSHTPHSILVCASHSFYSKLYTTPHLYTPRPIAVSRY